MSRDTTKPTKWLVRPVKTQISLGVRPVWSVFAVCMKKHWVLSCPLSAQRMLWSGWADAQADLSLRCAHMPFCCFCHAPAQILLRTVSFAKKSNKQKKYGKVKQNKGFNIFFFPVKLFLCYLVSIDEKVILIYSWKLCHAGRFQNVRWDFLWHWNDALTNGPIMR